jgi:hypothetical protein
VGLRVDGAGQTPRALHGVHLHKMKGPKQVLRAATLWEEGVPLEQLPKINSREGNRFFFRANLPSVRVMYRFTWVLLHRTLEYVILIYKDSGTCKILCLELV